MAEVAEIKAQIQEKRLEREVGIKAMWEDVAKKRKEIKEYKKRFFKK